MQTMEVEYMQLAEQKQAMHEYDAGMICLLRCHEEMHDAIKEPAYYVPLIWESNGKEPKVPFQ